MLLAIQKSSLPLHRRLLLYALDRFRSYVGSKAVKVMRSSWVCFGFAHFSDPIFALWLDARLRQHGRWGRYLNVGTNPFSLALDCVHSFYSAFPRFSIPAAGRTFTFAFSVQFSGQSKRGNKNGLSGFLFSWFILSVLFYTVPSLIAVHCVVIAVVLVGPELTKVTQWMWSV